MNKVITRWKRAEEALKQAKEYSELIYQVTPSAIFTVDKERCVTSWNRKAAELTGYSAEEVIGKPCLAFAVEPCGVRCGLYSDDVVKPLLSKECIIKRKDGQPCAILKNADLLKDASGNVIGGIESFEDITELKQAEEALRKSERRYRELFENAKDVVLTLDLNGDIISINEAGSKVSGYTRQELLGMNISLLLPREELERAREGIRRIDAGNVPEKTFEYEFIKKDGSRGILDISFRPVSEEGKITGIQGIARDITEKKSLQQKIVESERYLKKIVESTSDSIIALDSRGKIVLLNEGAEKMFGYTREELLGKNIIEGGIASFYGEIETARKIMQALRESKDGRITNFEVPGKTKDGRDIFLSVSASFLKNEKGELIGTLGIAKDITGRKRAEEELRLQAQLLDAATDSIFLHDLDANFIYLNRAAYEKRGYTKEEMMEMGLYKLVIPEYAMLIEPRIKELMEKGEAAFESAHFRKDKSIMPLEVRARTIVSGGRKLILSVNRDVTERKRMEREILEARDEAKLYLDLLMHDISNFN